MSDVCAYLMIDLSKEQLFGSNKMKCVLNEDESGLCILVAYNYLHCLINAR